MYVCTVPRGGQKCVRLFFAKQNIGGNSLNSYHPVKATSRDKQSFNLCGINNTFLLNFILKRIRNTLLYPLFSASNLRSFRQEFLPWKKACHVFCPSRNIQYGRASFEIAQLAWLVCRKILESPLSLIPLKHAVCSFLMALFGRVLF